MVDVVANPTQAMPTRYASNFSWGEPWDVFGLAKDRDYEVSELNSSKLFAILLYYTFGSVQAIPTYSPPTLWLTVWKGMASCSRGQVSCHVS